MPAPRILAVSALAVAGLTLLAAPLAASAHTGLLYTWGGIDAEENPTGFASLTTTGQVSLLSTQTDFYDTTGADICADETTWAVTDAVDGGSVFSWNHTSGALGALVELTVDPADLDLEEPVVSADVIDVWAADSLPGCVSLAYVYYWVDFEGDSSAELTYLAYVDRTTGATTPIALLPEGVDEESPLYFTGIATDPISGVTYLFGENGDNEFIVWTIDLASGELGEPEAMGGLMTQFESTGFPIEADFQPDGTLWLAAGINALQEYHLLSFAPGADLVTAGATDHGEITAVEPADYASSTVLTFDPASTLAATGAAPAPALIALGGLLLLAGGALVVRRRVAARS